MLQESSNIEELHCFLGLTGYYRKFIPSFADITKPLNNLLKKDIKFQWFPQCEAAFKNLQQALCKEPILQYPTMEKLYTLFTDTCHYAYSGIFTQAVEGPEDLQPIVFTSGSFPETQ